MVRVRKHSERIRSKLFRFPLINYTSMLWLHKMYDEHDKLRM